MSETDHAALLLTGRPGIGKTTALRRVAEVLDRPVAGFLTEEMREGGTRTGFRLVAFDGWSRVMAHVGRSEGPRVSKYRVDVDAVDEAVARLPDPADVPDALYLVDEIGKMECFSRAFVRRTEELVDADVPLVATVARRGGGFIAAVKERPDVRLVEVTRENRDELPERILAWISDR